MKTLVNTGEIMVKMIVPTVGQSFLEPGSLVGPFASGAPAIFLAQAAALGQPCGMISAVGDDDFGTFNIERLRGFGVDGASRHARRRATRMVARTRRSKP